MCISSICETFDKKTCRHQRLVHPDWSDDVRKGINSFLSAYGIDSINYSEDSYAVFDFDNTCSIFDVEEQLAIFQLQTMSFAFTPDKLPDILFTGLGDHEKDRSFYGYGNGSYSDWIADISVAYEFLYKKYGPFSSEGLNDTVLEILYQDPMWKEFATKMRAMYDLISEAESDTVSYPWILYWFTGMTEQQVYELAYKSHTKYKSVKTSIVHWESPAEISSKVGVVQYDWTSGIQVTDNIKELWSTLSDNGIDVWVCSASGTNQIRAAIDAFGLHDYCTGMLAMTNVLDENGRYVNLYDFENGCGWYARDNGKWEKMLNPEKSHTQCGGKVKAISNAIAPEYHYHGPIAGFMDSNGDYNFCTEFSSLKVVVCFNRASRKVTDGGGVIAEVAIYEKNTLGYDFEKADASGDVLYLLQGRNENGFRTFRSSPATVVVGTDKEILFANDDNEQQLKYIIDNKLTVAETINRFAIFTPENFDKNPLGFRYGFFETFDGYRSH